MVTASVVTGVLVSRVQINRIPDDEAVTNSRLLCNCQRSSFRPLGPRLSLMRFRPPARIRQDCAEVSKISASACCRESVWFGGGSCARGACTSARAPRWGRKGDGLSRRRLGALRLHWVDSGSRAGDPLGGIVKNPDTQADILATSPLGRFRTCPHAVWRRRNLGNRKGAEVSEFEQFLTKIFL
jgi:hypothetical protein